MNRNVHKSERNAQQIIGAKAVSAIFMMRELLQPALRPASLNSRVRLSDLSNCEFNIA